MPLSCCYSFADFNLGFSRKPVAFPCNLWHNTGTQKNGNFGPK